MRIGELARLAGCKPETIRYYERIGLIPRPAITSSGYRRYQPADLRRVQMIRALRALQMPLVEIGRTIANRRGSAPRYSSADLRRILRTQAELLDRRLRVLRELLVECDRGASDSQIMEAFARAAPALARTDTHEEAT